MNLEWNQRAPSETLYPAHVITSTTSPIACGYTVENLD